MRENIRTTSNEVPPLSIGAIMGDADMKSRQWGRSIGAVDRVIVARREGVVSPLNVNVVYHVDGRIAPNEFTGVRTGRFGKALSLLVVQAAVSDTSLEDPDDQHRVLVELLHLAVDEAEQYAVKKRIATSLDEIRQIVAQLPRSAGLS